MSYLIVGASSGLGRDLAYEFAKKAFEVKASEIHLVSSVGADSKSNNFYLKTKGQIEDAILGLKFEYIRIYRPGLLIGKRSETRLLEKLGLEKIKELVQGAQSTVYEV